MSTGTEIILKIDGDMDPVHLPLNEMLHRRDFERVMGLIEDSLKKAEEYCKKLERNKGCKELQTRRHDTILISGVRGSGKTTFMLSIKNRIRGSSKSSKCEMEGSQASENKFGFLSDILSLGILDPTLIESKEHVFTNILSRICEHVHEKAKRTNCFASSSSCCNEESKDGDYNAWKKSLEKLADGLKAMDGIGEENLGDGWMDSELLMDRGVKYSGAANRLELNFHLFINKSLNFLGKKAFILFLDDVDTNFAMGRPVLDVLHKYFTTPQLITVLSGDLKLYSTLVRGRQWKNFERRLLEMEAEKGKYSEERRQGFQDMVSHLEQQYLLKLLKSERRAFLSSVHQRIQEGLHVSVSAYENKQMGFAVAYEKLLVNLGITNPTEQSLFYSFLASQPIRTQRQLLSAGIELIWPNAEDEHSNPSHLEYEKFVWRVMDIFWSDLWEKRVDGAALKNASQATVIIALNYLLDNNLLEEGYTLKPSFDDDIVNACQFALGSIFHMRMQNDPSIALEYLIRIGLTREIVELQGGTGGNPGIPASSTDYVRYCRVNIISRGPVHITRLSTSYLRAIRNLNSTSSTAYAYDPWHGTIPLSGLAGKAKEAKSKLVDRIDVVRDRYKGGLTYVLLGLPLSAGTDHKGNSLPLISFYNLLGVIAEVMALSSVKEEDARAKRIAESLIKNSQYREYPFPFWGKTGALSEETGENDDADEEEKSDAIDSELVMPLAKRLAKWLGNGGANKDAQTTATVLGRTMTRFIYSMNRMDYELRKEPKLGVWLHRMTVVFLNSILVEEVIASDRFLASKISTNNPSARDNLFIENLKSVNRLGKAHFQFSRFLLGCPLWEVYIHRAVTNLDLPKALAEFTGAELNTDNSLGELFDEVSIRRPMVRGSGITATPVGDVAAQGAVRSRRRSTVAGEAKKPNFKVTDEGCMRELLMVMDFIPYDILNEMTSLEDLASYLREKTYLGQKYGNLGKHAAARGAKYRGIKLEK